MYLVYSINCLFINGKQMTLNGVLTLYVNL